MRPAIQAIALALSLHLGVAVAAPLQLPDSVRAALASARAAQKERRTHDAIEIVQSALARGVQDQAIETWQLAPLLRTLAEAYGQAGLIELAARSAALSSLAMQQAPNRHDDLRRWIAGEAAHRLQQAGALEQARAHMELALRDLATFVEQADEAGRAIAIETLLDDVRLAAAEGSRPAARASLLFAALLASRYGIDLRDIEEDLSGLLDLVDGRTAGGVETGARELGISRQAANQLLCKTLIKLRRELTRRGISMETIQEFGCLSKAARVLSPAAAKMEVAGTT